MMGEHVTEAQLLDHVAGIAPEPHIDQCAACLRRSRLLEEELRSAAPPPLSLRAVQQAAGEYLEPGGEETESGRIKLRLDGAEKLLTSDPIAAAREALGARDSISRTTKAPASLLALLTIRSHRIESHGYRLQGMHAESLACIAAARELLSRLRVQDYEAAVLDFCEAVILRELQQLAEADRLLQTCREVFTAYRDERRLIQTLLVQGLIEFTDLRYAAAATTFREVIRIAPDVETRTRARLNLGHALLQSGDLEGAAAEATHARAGFGSISAKVELVRVTWLTGRIALASGALERALDDLAAALSGFEALGVGEDASLARMDLAQVLLLLDRTGEARTHLQTALTRFSAAKLPHRAKSALAYLAEIVASDEISPDATHHVRDYLERLPQKEFLAG